MQSFIFLGPTLFKRYVDRFAFSVDEGSVFAPTQHSIRDAHNFFQKNCLITRIWQWTACLENSVHCTELCIRVIQRMF